MFDGNRTEAINYLSVQSKISATATSISLHFSEEEGKKITFHLFSRSLRLFIFIFYSFHSEWHVINHGLGSWTHKHICYGMCMAAGGLSAYFKAYPTVKIINRTVTEPSPSLPPPSPTTELSPKTHIMPLSYGKYKLLSGQKSASLLLLLLLHPSYPDRFYINVERSKAF